MGGLCQGCLQRIEGLEADAGPELQATSKMLNDMHEEAEPPKKLWGKALDLTNARGSGLDVTLRVQVPNKKVLGFLGNSNYSIGLGYVYDYLVLGPLG